MARVKLKDDQLDLLTKVSMYLMEDTSHIDNILAVIADVVEAKQVDLAWQKMTEEEALDVNYSGFASKVITEVEDGAKVIGLARQDTEWSVSCKLSFAVVAAFVTLIRNDVMNNYTEERVDAYKDFIKILQKSALSGAEAITISK